MAAKTSKIDMATLRLYRQRIAKSPLKHPAEAVSWMGAIQAQDYAGAKWSLGLRVPAATDADVEQAIVDRKIVRTWAMRGTLHFVSPSDIGWIIALLAPGIIVKNARRYRELELDERTMARGNAVIAKALQGNKQLDRPALVAILEKNGISTAGQRTPYLLQRAVMDRIICQGIMRSNNPTFMLLDETMLKNRFPDPEEAAAELALRYFTSRGPASLRDFIWWSGMSGRDASAALDAVQSKLVGETIEEQTYWFPRSKPISTKHPSAAYLLPGFDEYLLSYKDRSASMEVQRIKKLTPSNGMLPPTIVMNGNVIGIWKRTVRNNTVMIKPAPFARFTPAEQRAFEAAAAKYAAFLEKELEFA